MSNSYDPMDCNPPDSSAHGILQARILEWVAIYFFKRSSWPRDQIRISCTAGGFFAAEPRGSRSAYCARAVLCLVPQSYQILCDPVDCSPPGSSVHGILQARTLEWVAMPSSRGSSQPRSSTFQGIFPTQGSNPCLLHSRWILYHLSHQTNLIVP